MHERKVQRALGLFPSRAQACSTEVGSCSPSILSVGEQEDSALNMLTCFLNHYKLRRIWAVVVNTLKPSTQEVEADVRV